MTVIGIIIAALIEQYKFLDTIRVFFEAKLLWYVRFFINKDFKSQREIRYAYLMASIPVVLVLILLRALLLEYPLVYFVIQLTIFILCVQILSWKKESKNVSEQNKSFNFINSYATKFFAPLFWFWVLPCGIGVFVYTIVMLISQEIKNKELDLVVYNVIVDKMLFYANVIPYTLLYIFIALAGDFENILHYLISQRKNFIKGFYFLLDILNNIILISINKKKYDKALEDVDSNADAGVIREGFFEVSMVKYIVAVLYRAGLFFIVIIALVTIAHMVGLFS